MNITDREAEEMMSPTMQTANFARNRTKHNPQNKKQNLWCCVQHHFLLNLKHVEKIILERFSWCWICCIFYCDCSSSAKFNPNSVSKESMKVDVWAPHVAKKHNIGHPVKTYYSEQIQPEPFDCKKTKLMPLMCTSFGLYLCIYKFYDFLIIQPQTVKNMDAISAVRSKNLFSIHVNGALVKL